MGAALPGLVAVIVAVVPGLMDGASFIVACVASQELPRWHHTCRCRGSECPASSAAVVIAVTAAIAAGVEVVAVIAAGVDVCVADVAVVLRVSPGVVGVSEALLA